MNNLSETKALIINSNHTDKSSLKRALMNIGVKPMHIEVIDCNANFEETIKTTRPQIICLPFSAGKHSFKDYLNCFKKYNFDPLNTLSLVITDKNSKAACAIIADESVDVIITKPYNMVELEDKMTTAIKAKLAHTEEDQIINDLEIKYYKKMYDSVFDIIRGLNLHNFSRADKAYFYQGLVYKDSKQLDCAIESFTNALDSNEKFFKAKEELLVCLLDNKEYQRASTVSREISTEYSFNPNLIPTILRASIAAQDYQSLISFCDLSDELSDISTDIQINVAAGLAITGKYFQQVEDKEKSKKLLMKSIELSNNKQEILASVANTYLNLGMIEEAKNICDQFSSDEMKAEMMIVDLKLSALEEGPYKTIEKGNSLINKNVKSPEVYEILVSKSKEAMRDESLIQNLKDQASQEFPSYRYRF